ncbi:MAG: helix-turn-helix transcriptional regulator [Synechococcus sp. NP17]|nr:helix-turn-helix transcriptional regulator [Synechococcus sp. NP17]
MDLTSQIPRLQTRSRQGHNLLRKSRTAIASADRVLLASWMGWFQELGHLVAAATTEEECLQRLGSTEADLLICTDQLEKGTGANLVLRAKNDNPMLKALLLVQRPILRTILQAIDASCDGLCSHQNVGNGNVFAALTAIESDGSYLDPVIAGVLRHGRLGRRPPGASTTELSIKEEDVLRGLCKGMSNQDIADSLVVSIDTVKSHIGSLLRKLKANNRTHAVVVAFQEGLVEIPSSPPRWTY